MNKPDLSASGPYATKEDKQTARELGLTVRALRAQRAAEDKPQPKQTEDRDAHAIQNARGWSETITALVAALDVDFDRLEELRDERHSLERECRYAANDVDGKVIAEKALADWDEANGAELTELREAATIDGDEMKDADSVRERIQESPLEVAMRSGWAPSAADMEAEDFMILLSTGGPALRIRGELGANKEPRRAWLEYQDWGTPWTEFNGEGAPSQDDLLTFCSQFYFGG